MMPAHSPTWPLVQHPHPDSSRRGGGITDVAIQNLYQGPHLVEVHALDDKGRALPGVDASNKFFLRKESHEVIPPVMGPARHSGSIQICPVLQTMLL